MISQNTLFILGAGASAPYGYPLGGRLVDQILSGLQDESGHLWKELSKADTWGDDLKGFHKGLRGSQLRSIDLYMATDIPDEYVRIGKRAIATILLRCERDDALFDREPEGHWYQYLVNEMRKGADAGTFIQNNVKVVTFNYDRSFEYFFKTAIQNAFHLRPQLAWKLFQQTMPVVHVHGIVGDPGEYGNFRQPFSSNVVGQAAERIRNVFDQATGETESFVNARAMLREAETVCFLGFAYDSINIDRLHLKEHLSGEAKLFGTTFQLPDAERERALERLKPLHIDHRALDADAFLKTAPVW